MNQHGLNSQLAIGLGRSQRSSLNSKYFSGKYPNSLSSLCLICIRQICCCNMYKARVNALRASSCLRAEHLMGSKHLFELFLSDLDEKITSVGHERHTKGNSETSLSCPMIIIYLPCGVSHAKRKHSLTLDNFSLGSQ